MVFSCAEAINRQNVRMIERRRCPRFLLETSQSIGVRRQLFRQHLDCNFAVHALIAGAIDFAHAASAQRRDYFIGPKFCTRSEDHGRRDYNPGFCFSREFNTDVVAEKQYAAPTVRSRVACYNHFYLRSVAKRMKCPFCGFENDKVVDSRESKEAASI